MSRPQERGTTGEGEVGRLGAEGWRMAHLGMRGAPSRAGVPTGNLRSVLRQSPEIRAPPTGLQLICAPPLWGRRRLGRNVDRNGDRMNPVNAHG